MFSTVYISQNVLNENWELLSLGLYLLIAPSPGELILEDILQYTVTNTVSSCFTHVPYGVPQGSILGPLLFLLYVNDISPVLSGENVKLFADDINLFFSGVDVNTFNQMCNYCIDTLNHLFVANRLIKLISWYFLKPKLMTFV